MTAADVDVIGRMRRLIDAQTYGPPDDDGEIVGPFQKTWVLALLDVADAAEAVNEFLSDGHACLECGYGSRHRDDCVFVRFRAALNTLTERP